MAVYNSQNAASQQFCLISLSFGFSGNPDGLLQALIVTVHGDEDAIKDIKHLCKISEWRAFDSTTGDFINFGSSAA
jgi:hypothetical protein